MSLIARFRMPPLFPGRYTIDVGVYDENMGFVDEVYAGAAIELAECNYLQAVEPNAKDLGRIMVRSKWEVNSAK